MYIGGSVNCNFDDLVPFLLTFKKRKFTTGKYKVNKIAVIMEFNTIDIHWNIISGCQNKVEDPDPLLTFNLTEPPGYVIIFAPTDIFLSKCDKKEIGIQWM